jgi:hypothetical protein
MTKKPSKTLKLPLEKATNPLEAMHNRLPELLNANGLTVEDTDPQTAKGISKVTFVCRSKKVK